MMNKFFAFPLMIIVCICISLSGCSQTKETQTDEGPPVISPLHVLVPEAPGESVVGYSPLTLDISNTDQGYLTAISDSDSDRTNLQLITPDGTIYSYFIEPGEQAVVPFTGGNGDYQITCYQQIDGTQYAALYMETIEVNLENEFLPFLYPNQYVNFTPDTKACQLALSMLPEDTEDIDVLDAIYLYVTENITYDEEKAENIDAGYLPDIDDTLETGTGICFDYAALITAMLRCRGIPCKLQIGYAGTVKHAWIDVYIRSRGWVDKAISFDGDTWTRMDPTFDSNSQDKEAIRNYIGDGTNYNVQFTR